MPCVYKNSHLTESQNCNDLALQNIDSNIVVKTTCDPNIPYADKS